MINELWYMSKKFYVTTPIYYANGKPHIGNSYTSFIAERSLEFIKKPGMHVE